MLLDTMLDTDSLLLVKLQYLCTYCDCFCIQLAACNGSSWHQMPVYKVCRVTPWLV